MFTAEIETSIRESVLCWLATVDEDGVPNNSPKEVFLSYSKDELLIADIASPNSVKNIKNNSNVCVSFVHVFKQKGFKIKGTAQYFKKGNANFDLLFQSIYPITGTKYPVNGIILIKAKSVNPIIAPSYFLSPELTEEQQVRNARKVYDV